MAYTLHRLAPGSYDLALDDAIMGSVVLRPHPFTQTEHHFPSLEAAMAWLGGATVAESPT
jgi:hypothetical protein